VILTLPKKFHTFIHSTGSAQRPHNKEGARMKHSIICILVLFAGWSNLSAQWTLQSSPVNTELTQLYFATTNAGWASTGEHGIGEILHTTNGGSLWIVQRPEPVDTIFFVGSPGRPMSFISATTGWVIGSLGSFEQLNGAVLYRTTDGGSSWSRHNLSPWDFGAAVQFTDANNGWVAAATGDFVTSFFAAILRTTNGGISWTPSYTGNFVAPIPYFVDANTGWMLRDSLKNGGDLACPCEIYHTTNGGATWTLQMRDVSPGAYQWMHPVDQSNVWLVGDSAKVLRTTDGGVTWSSVPVSNMDPASSNRSVFFLTPNLGWVTGNTGSNAVVFHTTNAGATWSTQQVPFSGSEIHSIFFADANAGWIADGGGEIAHTTNGGITSVVESNLAPITFWLGQNYPNPFNPSTVIRYALPTSSQVVLTLYNTLGQRIRTLVDSQQAAGYHTIKLNADDLPSGVYFYRLEYGHGVITKKLLLAK
jgi:photosystem II stability/assembly factor-like uncharacterized protein